MGVGNEAAPAARIDGRTGTIRAAGAMAVAWR